MKEVENRQKLISLQLESVKAGGEQEYQLKMQQLVAQRDVELRQKELTEQMKLAITEKYNKEIYDLSVQHENDTAKKQADALKLRLDNELAEAKLNGDSELELLRMQEQQKLELKDSLRRMGEESDAEFRARQLAADQEYLNAKQAVIDKEVEMQQIKVNPFLSWQGIFLICWNKRQEITRIWLSWRKYWLLRRFLLRKG